METKETRKRNRLTVTHKSCSHPGECVCVCVCLCVWRACVLNVVLRVCVPVWYMCACVACVVIYMLVCGWGYACVSMCTCARVLY